MFVERRQQKRFPISEVVLFRRLNAAPSNRYSTGEARDISQGGLAFQTDELLFEGEQIELSFRQRQMFADTRVRAEVVRVAENGSGYGIGARFLPSIVNANEPALGQGALR